MVNTLALLLSSEERRRSRYAVETLSNDSDLYDSDLFVQGLLKVLTRASFCLSILLIVAVTLDVSELLMAKLLWLGSL